MEEKKRKRSIRSAQVIELNRVLKERVNWGEVVTPVLIRAIGADRQGFTDAVYAFVKAGGRVSDEVWERERHRTIARGAGHPLPLVTDALIRIDWKGMTRDEFQVAVNTPKETGAHFTCFLADWAMKYG